MDTSINICVIGETSVGKTTLISILLNKLAGVIKRSRSTLKWMQFIESNDTLELELELELESEIDNNELMNIVKIPKLKWICDDERKYKISLFDSVGLNDIEIKDNIYKSIEDKMDLIIMILDVGKGISTKSEKDVIDMVAEKKEKIIVCNKLDDVNDDELNENFLDMKKYLIENNKIKNSSEIIGMNCEGIYNIKISKNNKKNQYFKMLYNEEDELELLKIFGYDKLINLINDKIKVNFDTIIKNKLNLISTNINNIYGFYLLYRELYQINNTVPKINYYILNYTKTYTNNHFVNISKCIDYLNNHAIEILIKKFIKLNTNSINKLYHKIIKTFGINKIIIMKTFELLTDQKYIVKLNKNKLIKLYDDLNFLGEKINLYDIKIGNNTITKNLNIIVGNIITHINYILNNNDDYNQELYLLFICVKYTAITNLKLCKFFPNLQKILLLEFNNHSSTINNFICGLDNDIMEYNPLKNFTNGLIGYIESNFDNKNIIGKIDINCVDDNEEDNNDEDEEDDNNYMKRNNLVFKFTPCKSKIIKICLEAVKNNNIPLELFVPLEFVPDEFKTKEICLEAFKNNNSLEFVPDEFKTMEICLEAVKNNNYSLEFVPDEFKTMEICLEAIKRNYKSFKFVPDKFKTIELCLKVVKCNGLSLEFVPDKFKTIELCLKVVKCNGLLLKFVPDEFKTDELCVEAIKNNGLSLEFIPDKFKTYELCFKSLVQNHGAIKFVPDELISCKLYHDIFYDVFSKTGQFVEYIQYPLPRALSFLEKIKQNDYVLKYMVEHNITEEICIEAIKHKNSDILQYIPAKFKTTEFYLKAMKHMNIELKYIPDKLKTKKLCEESLIETGRDSIEYIPDELKTKEFYLESVINYDLYIFKYIPNEFVTKELCLEIIKQDGRLLEYIPDEFIDYELCLEAIKQNYKAIKFVPEKFLNEKFCQIASKVNIFIFRYLYDKYNKFTSREICMKAIQQNYKNIDLIPIKFIDKELFLEAVKHNYLILNELIYTSQYNYLIPCKFIDEELYIEIFKYDKFAIQNLTIPDKFKSEKLYLEVVKQDGLLLYWVDREFKTKKICEIAIKQNVLAKKYVPIEIKLSIRNYMKRNFTLKDREIFQYW
jgi:hypothetical protein